MVTWDELIDALPKSQDEEGEGLGIWGEDDEVVCKSKEVADVVATILEILEWPVTQSKTPDGYYRVSV